jgi:transposase InsO family protein
MILGWITDAVGAGARQDRACAVLGLDARTLQRWRSQGPDGHDGRGGPCQKPCNALTEAERQEVLTVAHSEPFRDASPKTIVPTLADRGVYLASESTFYRVLRDAGERVHRGRARPPTPRPIPTHTATGPNQVWSWDITYLPTVVRGVFFYLYLMMDIWSRRIMGWAVHLEESGEHAARLLLRACREAEVEPGTLVLHSDNGGPMRGATLLATMQKLAVISSFSRPSVSDDNAFSEALFRTLKYVPWWPTRPFATVAEAVQWVEPFARWYNMEHLHSGIAFVTPEARHRGGDVTQLAQRREVYGAAQRAHPERWSGSPRDWSRPEAVSLNARHPRRSSAPTTVPTTVSATQAAAPGAGRAGRQSLQEALASRLPSGPPTSAATPARKEVPTGQS